MNIVLIIALTLIVILLLGIELIRRTPFGRMSLVASLIRRTGSGSEDNPESDNIELRRSGHNNDIRLVSKKPRSLHQVSNVTITGLGRDIPVRIYQPSVGEGKRVCLYYHGGGYVLGNLGTADSLARELSFRWDAIVISVDYALAPEHRYPATVEDGFTALLWAFNNAEKYGGDSSNIILSGDSAGGNLAAATVLKAHEHDGPAIAAQVLFYPWIDLRETSTKSMRNFATGYLLSVQDISWFTDQYLPDADSAQQATASPVMAEDFSVFPPTIVFPAEFDILRDQGLTFAEKLGASGVLTQVKILKGQLHGLVSMTRFFPGVIRRTLIHAGKFLDSLETQGSLD